MDVRELEAAAQTAMTAARDSLQLIEETVRERGESVELMATSRLYAQFCMHTREFLAGTSMGRPFPRRYAHLLEPVLIELRAVWPVVGAGGLHPTPDEIERLRKEAISLPGKA